MQRTGPAAFALFPRGFLFQAADLRSSTSRASSRQRSRASSSHGPSDFMSGGRTHGHTQGRVCSNVVNRECSSHHCVSKRGRVRISAKMSSASDEIAAAEGRASGRLLAGIVNLSSQPSLAGGRPS